MAKKKPKTYPIAKISWVDAWGNASWMAIDEAIEHYAAGAACTSVGYLIKESKEGYLLAGTIGERDVNAMFFIPRGWVRDVKRG